MAGIRTDVWHPLVLVTSTCMMRLSPSRHLSPSPLVTHLSAPLSAGEHDCTSRYGLAQSSRNCAPSSGDIYADAINDSCIPNQYCTEHDHLTPNILECHITFFPSFHFIFHIFHLCFHLSHVVHRLLIPLECIFTYMADLLHGVIHIAHVSSF